MHRLAAHTFDSRHSDKMHRFSAVQYHAMQHSEAQSSVITSHRRTVPSSDALARYCPSGEIATALTALEWPKYCRQSELGNGLQRREKDVYEYTVR